MAGWEECGGSCYYYRSSEGVGAANVAVWPHAQETCQRVGGSLTVLEDRLEDAYLMDRLPLHDTVWLGLRSKLKFFSFK